MPVHRIRLAAFVLFATACSHRTPPAPVVYPEAPAPEALLPAPLDVTLPPTPDAIRRLLDSLPVRAKVAQLVMPWIAGSYAAFDDAAFLRAQGWVDSLEVGGIIVSIGSPLDIAAKLNALQRSSRLPLLVASDLEAGSAMRFTGGTAFPTNMGVGATGRELDAYEMGRITALEGRAVGIHLAFAPVADVNNNPANPIINTRSFGEDPAEVARLVAAEIRGLQEHGLLATAKHFPGHGDTGTDSHIALPVITAPWARLDSVELVPFRAAVKSGVTAIMSAHIALPGVEGDSLRPATLAPDILTGLLRDSLGFRGLIVTDALDMGGIVSRYGAGEAAVLAFLAGADLLLQPASPREAIDALTAAVGEGRVSISRLDQSLRKVLELKRRLGLFRRRTVPLDYIPAVVGAAAHQAIARDVAARSIVLARDDGTVDSLRAGPRSVTVVSYADDASGNFGATLAAELRAAGHTVTTFRLFPPSGPASYDSARVAIARSPFTIFAASVRVVAWSGSVSLPGAVAELIDSTATQRPIVLASFGSPYLLNQVPLVRSYLLAWGARPMNEQVVAQALSGFAPITGRLPVSLAPDLPRGSGLQREDAR
jgi:beta-N-acetylhexosaminidase